MTICAQTNAAKNQPQCGSDIVGRGESKMRLVRLLFAIVMNAIAAFTMLAAPSLAKSADVTKADEKPASPPCDASQQDPGGSWIPIPCREIDSGAQMNAGAPAKQKTSTRNDDEPSR
jgi:hypothetical protein